MARMLYAVLICSDEACAEEFEAWGELADFDDMVCEGCGCTLQPLAFSDVGVDDRRLPTRHAARPAPRRRLAALTPS